MNLGDCVKLKLHTTELVAHAYMHEYSIVMGLYGRSMY